VDYVNRFRTKKQQTATLTKLKEGKVDILIGTHRILGKDVVFKDLGLMIIDEEQKFGVAAKEKLKSLRVNVDSLTLTATPIPRTLHFSLMGARDLSVINTPPPNRQPIITEVHAFNKEILKEAIDKELERGGQVFLVHNRVKDIEMIADMVEEICPRARTIVGHGQMAGDQLENVMVSFIEGDYDVLVATTIIESGLDIPNANTIIINNAHNFGLSDLHQMRGRVGRSNKKAYAYLFAPPKHTLSDDAQRRMTAIEEYSDLGSGFSVAMKDLDIRGAGNLLGGEQSGFIAEIGFNMYHKILDEAVEELKNEEFADLLTDAEKVKERDCIIETDLDIMIPQNYVQNVSERLSLYNDLARIKEADELKAFEDMLRDRFGNLPVSVQHLLQTVRLKWLGMHRGIEKIAVKNGRMRATFPPEEDTAYYQSETFEKIIKSVQLNPQMFKMSQKGNKLMVMIEDIKTIDQAMEKLGRL
jgi:transcription-repair coupling factor (superfamily II helicase)